MRYLEHATLSITRDVVVSRRIMCHASCSTRRSGGYCVCRFATFGFSVPVYSIRDSNQCSLHKVDVAWLGVSPSLQSLRRRVRFVVSGGREVRQRVGSWCVNCELHASWVVARCAYLSLGPFHDSDWKLESLNILKMPDGCVVEGIGEE